ncbi:hypothetical protein COLO4_17690 [Corchorus olitorius]|uniref:Protein kinase domain-containing protein n=1 Tax=Corchorus olitorius TaxID=93759 RepID=A0A1R3JBU6_9ROSI|nr:hypothetical protein COLO4_17690 [Corchorus olitorius]
MTRNCNCLFPNPLPGKWLKGKAIGSGAFGTVHLALNKANGSLFVVKSAESCAGLESLENEANILEGLNSPFIVQCMGKELSKGLNGELKINVFMEYMAGGSLSDVAEKFGGGAMDEEMIRSFTRGILYGLKYLHEQGIVHCDLKCTNVLLGSSGNVKLTDFGCAKRLKDMKETLGQSVGGTPLWMAPEILRNEGLDYSADIWSLGCTVIEMATGKPPWSDEFTNPAAAILKIACSNDKPLFPSKFSKKGLDFLSKCLERNPKRRWTAEELLEHPFILGKKSSARDITRIDDGSCSPSSILDIGMYDYEYDSESDESDEEEEESLHVNPFSTRQQQCMVRKQEGADLEPLEDWITVRSG